MLQYELYLLPKSRLPYSQERALQNLTEFGNQILPDLPTFAKFPKCALSLVQSRTVAWSASSGGFALWHARSASGSLVLYSFVFFRHAEIEHLGVGGPDSWKIQSWISHCDEFLIHFWTSENSWDMVPLKIFVLIWLSVFLWEFQCRTDSRRQNSRILHASFFRSAQGVIR